MNAAPASATPGVPPLLLDTHAWVWWVSSDETLPANLRPRIQTAFAARLLWVSAISAWEVALLVQRGRLELTLPVREWIGRSEALGGLRFLPIDVALAARAVELADLHADPADRLIVASAERLGAVLATRDERLRAYAGVASTWGEDDDGRV